MLRGSHKKRFIAGAVCPACKQVDKLQLWSEAGENVFQCVSCGHQERQPLDKSAIDEKDDSVQAVKFID